MNDGEAYKDDVLQQISLEVRMQLARIIDPRHDRDPDMVMAEVRAICDVLVSVVQKIVKIELDTAAASGVHSATATQEANEDAEYPHSPSNQHPAPADKHKRRPAKAQVPLP